MTFEDLAKWQKRHNLTNVRLAEELGCAPYTVTRWRTGVTQIPGPVARLCELQDAVKCEQVERQFYYKELRRMNRVAVHLAVKVAATNKERTAEEWLEAAEEYEKENRND